MSPKLDILLIEENDVLAANIADFLTARGHRLDFVSGDLVGLGGAIASTPDVILIEHELPWLDGLTLCRTLRETVATHIPVLMLSAGGALDDKLAGFAHGADDYLVKPFSLLELAARIDALSVRRRFGTTHKIVIGDLTVDRQTKAAMRQGHVLRLSPILREILLILAEAYPQPVLKRDLSRKLWGDDPPMTDALRSHMRRLRMELDKPFETKMLDTVYGSGFRLVSAT